MTISQAYYKDDITKCITSQIPFPIIAISSHQRDFNAGQKNSPEDSSTSLPPLVSGILRLKTQFTGSNHRMMRDFKFLRRNSGKNLNLEEPENVPVNVNLRESSVARMGTDSHSRPPLNTIQEPLQNPSKPDQESGFKSSKIYRTPTKAKVRYPDSGMPMRTPEKQGVLARNRNGWGQDSRDEGRIGNVNTPRSCRTLGRTSSAFAEPNSTQSTPTKSVGKPPNPGLVYGGNSRPPISGGVRTCNFTALSKGIPVTCNTNTNVNAIEVPHFDLKEDPSFWMDHNVQVLIRIRPLNGMEIGTQGYNRCLKQESAQCLTWVGHPETRFTFDHVACETINQETLFKMVGLPMVENCLSGYNSCMFAYGQTGSGKTHTMLGEINDLEVKPSPYRGMTPRIFEFLFARIIAEEESRRDERLTYCCKCSFLEIYNEQITDLLDPSSTNLQLREDVKKGVYVENLTEFEVNTVGDILKLLSQGSANRRVAATNMNRESSRSHSVFTCVIESRWEKDSTSNLRFARLNLVDLAGSERQKSSGAEGERLKEAASINKSLSTLGHVIMVLVDGANARTRHVPYRDSRLTFLLQDSLGGNSKTMIIANVSPSISSATETLNTLKFAQRAKLIQNNEELAILKRYNISKSLTFSSKDAEEARQEHENCSNASSLEMNMLKFDNMLGDEGKVLRVSSKQLKSLETSLNGALRREQSTESSIKQLEAEIEQLNCLVRQREEENRCTKMMLKFREDKIQRMESLLAGSIPADSYLLEENNTLSEEIRILRAKVDRNPEVTRFAVENIRLLEQLRRFQDFYEEGEREMLMTEVSELRDQLVLFLDENSKEDNHMNSSMEKEAAEDQKESDSLELELKKSQEELDKCRGNLNSCLEKNSKLCREIVELNALLEMQNSVVHDQDGGIEVIKEPILESSSIGDEASHTVQKMDDSLADTKEVLDLQLELDILKIILKEERLTHGETVEKALSLSRDLKLTEEKFLLITKQCEYLREELQEAKSVIEALEIQQLVSINELEDLKNSNKQYAEILREKELKIIYLNDQILSQGSRDLPPSSNDLENEDSPLQGKLNKVQASLSKAKRLNMWYQADRACHASNEEEMDEVRRQVESETTEVIVCLQEELVSFQQQMHESSLKERETQRESTLLQEKLGVMTECNKALREKCEEKDRRLNSLSEEIEEVLTAGHKVLDDASNQLGPGKRTWVSDQLQVIARNISEKELRIEELNSYLEDAKSRGNEMECMLRSLRGATLVMSEAHQQDCIKKDQEIHQLLSQLSEKSSIITQLDDTVNQTEEQNRAMSVCATAAFVIVNRFSEIKDGCLEALNQKEAELDKLKGSLTANESLIHSQAVAISDAAISDAEKQLGSLKEELETAGTGIGSSQGVNKDLNIDEDVKLVIPSCRQKTLVGCRTSMGESHSDDVLLKKELESTLESLEGVKTEVADYHSEKEVQFPKKQNPRSIEIILPQVLDLQAVVDNFQEQVGTAMVSLDCRLRTVGELLQQSNKSYFQKRKIYELELIDAKLNAAEKAVESSCYLEKFVEIQHDINEADFMIYELVTANEAMKREVGELRGKLLADIKNSFDRISRKENEAGEISIKVASFEKKMLDLQLLEEAMLEQSSHMGHEISMLMKEMDVSHQKQQVINDKDEKLKDNLMMDLGAKEIELFIMSSRLEQMALENNDLEKEKISMSVVLEKFKEDMIISYVDMQLKDWILLEKDAESCLLQKEIKMQEEALKISYNRSSALEQMASEANVLEKEKSSMSMVLEKVKEDMIISYVDLQLKDWILLEKDAEVCLLQKEVRMQEEALKISCNHSSALDKMASENNNLEGKMISMSTVLEKFKEDMIISYVDMHLKDWILLEKDAEIGLMQKEVKMQEEALKISYNHSSALEQMASETIDLKEEKISMSMVFEKLKEDMIILHVDMQLKDWILLEKDAEVGLLQKEVQIQEEEALKIYCDRSSVLDKMASENKDLEKEKISMSVVLEKFKEDIIISYLDMQFKDCILLEKDAEVGLLQKEVEMLEEALKIFCNRSSALEQMASETNDLEKEKIKEDMINLYVDMQLQVKMEEEAHKEENETLVVIINDQKDKIEEFEACIEALEYELCENVVKGQVLEAQLKEKVALISTLEADFSRDRESIKSLSSEIHLLMENVEDALKAKESSKEQLSEMMKAKESMEIEILELETALDKNNTLIESLKGDLKTVTCERSDLHIELLRARKEVEMAQALAEKHEAIAMKAKQTGEISIRYAEEKEEESKLYEKSVEELECTVNVLENQVNMVKGEAERQRLQREELEIELHALKQQIHTVKNSDSDMRRHLDDEKEKNLQDVLQRIKILEKEIASKDAEFKALEAMADQVKPDGTSRDLSNSPSKRLERNGSRSRGSGSPFKCIGLGLGQQLKSERDEELIAARVRIEELEALAASRQKEIFTINAKLAMSGSMTHDVLRDLLGIKSDMNTYSSIVDDNQIEEVTGKIRIHDADSQVKEQEVIKLKQELNEFVVERQRWREEIERKHVEMEQICLQDQLLATENEKFKKKVIDLEAEIKKLSGLQNIQQRIHHHAKIKEENNSLKAQIDEISHKLRRSEGIVTRVKEELANLRAAANGKHPC
ncbi:hypothetical protein Ccrd_010834 [Cynara cardunculus var. scolymus]|uniref:Kinesin motor domain-containing protein n=1 Tax=Cynara cardunculus var. scolymus TaxID=59895 RepID=A0A103YKC2_CYNCS|nr:hypothetical protein Ccrd_010834 [Cynara cardunculus var. scolymus]